MPKPKKKGAVATASSTAVSEINIADFLESNAGDGMQNVSTDDLKIPRLKIKQRVDDDAPEDAKDGAIYNDTTLEVFEEGVKVIPCLYEKAYTQWVKDQGGFMGSHPATSDILTRTKKDGSKDMLLDEDGKLTDNYIRTDANFYVLYQSKDGGWKPATISMYVTQFKKAKQWNTVIKSQTLQGKNGIFNPPSYAYTYDLSTKPENNDKNKWFGWVVETGEQVADGTLLTTAKTLANSVRKGEVTAKPEDDGVVERSSTEDSGMI